jgi:hypothetical protein
MAGASQHASPSGGQKCGWCDWSIGGSSHWWFSSVALIALEHHDEGIANCIAPGDHATMRRAAGSRCAPPTLPGGFHLWLSSMAVIGGYHRSLSSIAVFISAVGHAVGSCCRLLSHPVQLVDSSVTTKCCGGHRSPSQPLLQQSPPQITTVAVSLPASYRTGSSTIVLIAVCCYYHRRP